MLKTLETNQQSQQEITVMISIQLDLDNLRAVPFTVLVGMTDEFTSNLEVEGTTFSFHVICVFFISSPSTTHFANSNHYPSNATMICRHLSAKIARSYFGAP